MQNPGPRNIIGFLLLAPALASLVMIIYLIIVHSVFQHNSEWAWQWFGDFGNSQLPIFFGLMSIAGVYCLVRMRRHEVV